MNRAWRGHVSSRQRVCLFHLAGYGSTSSTHISLLLHLLHPRARRETHSPSAFAAGHAVDCPGSKQMPRLINSVRVIRKLNGSPAILN